MSLIVSHPPWVRGLKRSCVIADDENTSSHPPWVRGLKLAPKARPTSAIRRTLRGCVD